MSLIDDLRKFFGDDEPTDEEKKELFNATVLLTLSRATAADTNIKTIEVETVRDIIEKTTGEAVESKDVRMAANSRIYETAPLDKHLVDVGRKLDVHHRRAIALALADVIKSDERISSKEVRFFNMVADSLTITPAEIAGPVESE